MTKFDFGSLGGTPKTKKPIDPNQIFSALPSLPGTHEALWNGQALALGQWHNVRTKSDILVDLNTGGGKTLVGLLIAQSLVNEGLDHVVYVCSTNDLVNQTAKEAEKIGIKYTLRTGGRFTNELFELGQAFCITTYSALFNGLSAIRKRYPPDAIIFDDAHVAEGILRDAFTIRVSRKDSQELFAEIVELFRPAFSELGCDGRFRQSIQDGEKVTSFVPPRHFHRLRFQLDAILRRHGVQDDEEWKYAFAHLSDHLHACGALFSNAEFEITPPFLPSLAIDVFEKNIRRVYLSATLNSDVDIVRAFGRRPTEIICPDNDAGKGERLILSGLHVKDGISVETASLLTANHKVLIAVPSYARAKHWKDVAVPPPPQTFSDQLDEFRASESGAFLLVSRVDGIDLPNDTCRIMIMDGLPSGTTILERYQWETLAMMNVHHIRMANRITQLFGRINRGRKDYGVFLIEGRELNIFLQNDRTAALLPPLLQRQVALGRTVAEGFKIKDGSAIIELTGTVLARDSSWLSYYEKEVKLHELDPDELVRAERSKPAMIAAAEIEAKFAAALWKQDFAAARRCFFETIDETSLHDSKVGGWHAVWLAAAFDLENDADEAGKHYELARKRLGSQIYLPRRERPAGTTSSVERTPLEEALFGLVGVFHGNKVTAELSKLATAVSGISIGTPKQAEAALEELGAALGFESSRPDNDLGTGPDVLWEDSRSKTYLSFELKTDKLESSSLSKKEVGQGHNHIEWGRTNLPDHESLGLIFVGPSDHAHVAASPSSEMFVCEAKTLRNIGEAYCSLLQDLLNFPPVERIGQFEKIEKEAFWTLSNLFARMAPKKLEAK